MDFQFKDTLTQRDQIIISLPEYSSASVEVSWTANLNHNAKGIEWLMPSIDKMEIAIETNTTYDSISIVGDNVWYCNIPGKHANDWKVTTKIKLHPDGSLYVNRVEVNYEDQTILIS